MGLNSFFNKLTGCQDASDYRALKNQRESLKVSLAAEQEYLFELSQEYQHAQNPKDKAVIRMTLENSRQITARVAAELRAVEQQMDALLSKVA